MQSDHSKEARMICSYRIKLDTFDNHCCSNSSSLLTNQRNSRSKGLITGTRGSPVRKDVDQQEYLETNEGKSRKHQPFAGFILSVNFCNIPRSRRQPAEIMKEFSLVVAGHQFDRINIHSKVNLRASLTNNSKLTILVQSCSSLASCCC